MTETNSRGVSMADENTVFVGHKPVMNYVLACVTQLNRGAGDITIKARGRAISRAVDVAEILRKRFMPEVGVKDIRICTEQINTSEGARNVSAMEIIIGK